MEWAEIDALRCMSQPGSSRRQSAEPSRLRNAPGTLDDALIGLAIAEERLVAALRENTSLKVNNEHLMRALEGSSRQAVAAQRVAHHDGLTGLPNRLLLIKRLQQAIRHAAERHRQLALLFIDLDGFKTVNDRYGHTVADRLLPAVGGRIAEKIRKHIGESYSIDGMEIHFGASIGLAVYPDDGERYDVLLQHADAAMFRNKAARRATSRLCEMKSSAGAANRERLAAT